MPRVLRPPALLLRNTGVLRRRSLFPKFTYEGDGLGTVHHSPFLHDEDFAALYEETADEWFEGFPGERVDNRWRAWLLTRLARSAQSLPGSFAEFGTYRAGYARMILSTTELTSSQRFYLFDTYAGIPSDRLTESEEAGGLGGSLAGTSVEYVAGLLERWADRIEIVEGDVFDTLEEIETGDLAFAHLDLNASAPTVRTLEYLYPRLLPGGIAAFDDYGFTPYEQQRIEIDRFFAELPEEVIALPTGQGMLIKRSER